MKRKRGVMESSRPSYSNDSKVDDEEINEHYNEIDMKEDSLDPNCEIFLNNLEQFGYGHDHDHDHEEELNDLEGRDGESCWFDADYKIFMENLREDGDGISYSVEFPTRSGISNIIRYEGKEEELENDPQYKIFSENLREDGDGESYLVDANYKMFLDNLREDRDGVSYSVEILTSSGISNIIRYEGKEEESFKSVDRKRNFKNDSKREKAKVPENLSGFSRKTKTEMPKTVKKSWEMENEGSKNNVRDLASEDIKTLVGENEVEEEAEVNYVPCKSSREPSKKMTCDMIDERWAQFLESLDKRGNNMEPSHESDDTSIHLKNDGSCSDLEIVALDNIGDHTPFVPSKCYQSLPGEESWDVIRTPSQSQFREKLMDLLKIPYDRQEFENLWQQVTNRKPVEGNRELRHGLLKLYPTKVNGKSYLDWYKEYCS
ncbi:hypothetical protein DITRI_Ditri05aG0115000 [Diplodiscus trichospermus]